MIEGNVVSVKSKAFAIRIIKMCKYLYDNKHEYVLAKQVLRSGTSIGANVAEAVVAFSKKDFLAKMYIAFKKCAETQYWLELLHETEYLTKEEFDSLIQDCTELKIILCSITKSTSESLSKNEG